MKRELGGCVLALLVGCSPEAGSPPDESAQSGSAGSASGPSGSAAVTGKDRENVIGFFEDVGTRTAASLKIVADAKPKSKIAYAEPLIMATPAAFSAHVDLFEKRGLTLDRFTEVMAEPDVEKRAVAALQAKIDPLQKELAAMNLPETDADDCTALARRLTELLQEGPSKTPIVRALAPSLLTCIPVVPKHVSECLPNPKKPSTVQEFDACVAKGAPAKK